MLTDDDREFLVNLLKEESQRRQAADKTLVERQSKIEIELEQTKQDVASVRHWVTGHKAFIVIVVAIFSVLGPALSPKLARFIPLLQTVPTALP